MFKSILFLVLFLASNLYAYEFYGHITGENQSDQFGNTLCTVDFNNDTYQDLVVAAPANDENGQTAGKVYLYFGGPAADTLADMFFIGPAESFFGKSLASAGDFNNDGAEDLLIGAPFLDNAGEDKGAVYLYYGGTSPDNVPDHIFFGENARDYFGIAVSSAGDFNNDTYDDIVIGAYKNDWGSFIESGKAYVFYGGPEPNFMVDKILTGDTDGERFGYALTSGDFNGDSRDDIAVGAYSYNGTMINQGRIYLFYGGTDPDELFDLDIVGDSAGYKFGWTLTSGRVNDDAYDDLIMGTDGYPVNGKAAGKVYVFDGGPSIDNTPTYTFTFGRAESDLLGSSIVSGTDLNGDGRDDIMAGSPGNSDSETAAGATLAFLGGSLIREDTVFYGTVFAEELGTSVCLWPDFADKKLLVSGAYAYDNYTGRIHLFDFGFTPDPDCCQGIRGNANCEGGDEPDVSDIVRIIDYLYLSRKYLCCPLEADVNGSGGDPDISDIVRIIDYLYLPAHTPPALCPSR